MHHSSSPGTSLIPVKYARSSPVLFAVLLLGAIARAETPVDLVQQALTHRDSIRGASLELSAAKRSAWSLSAYPATRLETGFASRPDVGGGEDLSLFQPVDLFGKTRAGRASQNAAIRGAESTYRLEELGVQHEVLVAYAAWANAERNLRYAKDQLEVVRQADKATKVRVAARDLPEIQATRAALELSKAEQAVVDRQAQLDAARIKLEQTVGDILQAPALADDDALSPSLLAEPTPEKTRPELLSLQAELSGAQADFRQANLSRFPDLEIQARRSTWSSDAEQYGVRLQFVFPLWDHGAATQKMKSARDLSTASRLRYSDTQKRVNSEIEIAKIQLDAAQKSYTAYLRILDSATSLMKKTQRGFELGAASLFDVFDAKRALDDALAGVADARYNLDLAVESALQARGQILGEKP